MRFCFVAASLTLAITQLTPTIAADRIISSREGSAAKIAMRGEAVASSKPAAISLINLDAAPQTDPDSPTLPADAPDDSPNVNLTATPTLSDCAAIPPASSVAATHQSPALGAPAPSAFVPGDMSSGKCMCPPPPPACPSLGQTPVIPGPVGNISHPSSQGASLTGPSPNGTVVAPESEAPPTEPTPTLNSTDDSVPSLDGSGDGSTATAATMASGSLLTSIMVMAITAAMC